MKSIIFFFISIFSVSSFADTVNSSEIYESDGFLYQKYKEGPITGDIIGAQSGKVVKGKREGIWTFYMDNGRLFFKAEYLNGIQNGMYESYSDNKIFDKGIKQNGKRIGLWHIYGYYNYEIVFYRDDKREGETKVFDNETGKLIRTEFYKNNICVSNCRN